MAAHTANYYARRDGPVKRSLPASVQVTDVRFRSVYLGRSPSGERAEAWDVEFWWRFMKVKSRRISGDVMEAMRWMSAHGSLTRSGPGHCGWTLHSPIEVVL